MKTLRTIIFLIMLFYILGISFIDLSGIFAWIDDFRTQQQTEVFLHD